MPWGRGVREGCQGLPARSHGRFGRVQLVGGSGWASGVELARPARPRAASGLQGGGAADVDHDGLLFDRHDRHRELAHPINPPSWAECGTRRRESSGRSVTR